MRTVLTSVWLFLFLYIGSSFTLQAQTGCMVLYGSAEQAISGEAACVELRARNFVNIFRYQYTLQYDPALIRYDSIQDIIFPSVGNLDIDTSQPGMITVIWQKNNNNPFNVPGNPILFRLCFTSIGSDGSQAVIHFTDDPVEAGVWDINNERLNFAGLSGSVNIGPDPSPVRISNGCPQSQNCATGVEGKINISGTFGNNPTFLWEDENGFFASTEDISGALEGVYQLTVTDDVNNLASGFFTIDISNKLQVASVEIVKATCSGIDDGSIDILVIGGSNQYSYNWSNGSQEEDISDLPPGSYSVTISDALGCEIIEEYEVLSGYDLDLSFFVVNCETAAGNDGSIDITLNGGVEPFEYIWSNGSMNEDLENVTAGFYNLTISDANGCSVVSQPIEVCSSNFEETDGCFTVAFDTRAAEQGDNICVDVVVNNFIDITSLQYSITWDPTIIKFLDLQNYNLPYLDTFNFNLPIAIADNGPLVMVWDDPFVEGITVDDETTMFQMCFEITGQQGQSTILQLTNSPLVIEATSKSGNIIEIIPINKISGGVNVNDTDPPLKVGVSCIEHPVCFADNNGLIDILVTGGTKPYNYNWSNGSSDQDLENVGPGGYQVTVTDGSNNSSNFSVSLVSSTQIIFGASSDTVICSGEPLNLFVDAPNATSITWSPSDELSCDDCPNPIGNISSSMLITVEVTDSNNCVETREINVTVTDTLIIENVTLIDNMDDSYTITFNILGGNPSSYQVVGLGGIGGNIISNTFVSDPIPGELPYFFTVTDASSCGQSSISGGSILPCNEYLSCSWAGDANTDGKVDVLDLFNVGLGNGTSGPARIVQGNSWEGKYSFDWDDETPVTNVNYKHIDANGDGNIDIADVSAIENNYGLNNSFGPTSLPFPGGTNVQLELASDDLEPGMQGALGISFGDVSQDVYALSFSLTYDDDLIVPGSVSLQFENSWMGEPGTDLVSIVRHTGTLDVAVTRTDGNNRSGAGKIATLRFVVNPDALDGAMTDTLPLNFSFDNLIFIDNSEQWKTGIPVPSQSRVIKDVVGITDPILNASIIVAPNPSTGMFSVESSRYEIEKWQLIGTDGRLLYEEQLNDHRFSSSRSIPPGIYYIRITTKEGVVGKKLVIVR